MEHLRRDILAQSLSGLWLFRKGWAPWSPGSRPEAGDNGVTVPRDFGACLASLGSIGPSPFGARGRCHRPRYRVAIGDHCEDQHRAGVTTPESRACRSSGAVSRWAMVPQ